MDRDVARKMSTRRLEEPPGPDADAAALKKIVALVNVSDRSVRTVKERLAKAGFEAGVIDKAVGRALEYGLLDDTRFAHVLVYSRVSQGKGLAGIERELQSHDISPDSLSGWPQEYVPDEEYEFQRALDVLESRPPRSKNIRDGAFRRLVQKGYAVPIASRAARVFCETVNAER